MNETDEKQRERDLLLDKEKDVFNFFRSRKGGEYRKKSQGNGIA